MTHKILLGTLGLSVLFLAVSIGMRIATSSYTYKNIFDVPETQVALILGASVVRGSPSPILARRADMAIALYEHGKVSEILISGDSRELSHDEVTPVREYLLVAGVPSEDIVLDRVGFDTYSSVYRSREIFRAQSLTIVTQDFHLPRALWVARRLGLNAYGVVAGVDGSMYDYVREIPASIKALFDILTGRQQKYLDSALPFNGELRDYWYWKDDRILTCTS